MGSKNILFLIITAILFFVFGIGFSFLFFNQGTSVDIPVDPNNTYQAGWEAAKKRLIELGAIQLLDSKISVKSISGTIEEKQGNQITVKIIPLEPLADPDLDSRIIAINNSTKIYKMVKKDDQQYQQELMEFNKNIKESQEDINTSDFPIRPDLYIKKEATIEEIQVQKKVEAKAMGDIRNVKQFTAQEIIIRN